MIGKHKMHIIVIDKALHNIHIHIHIHIHIYNAAIEKKFLAIISAFFMKKKKEKRKSPEPYHRKGKKIRRRKKKKEKRHDMAWLGDLALQSQDEHDFAVAWMLGSARLLGLIT